MHMPEENWVEVGRATTNRIPDSNVDIFLDLDGPPICPNMTDAEFRETVVTLAKKAVMLTDRRINELSVWNTEAQDRVESHFGRKDATTREYLVSRLPKLRDVLDGLGPKN